MYDYYIHIYIVIIQFCKGFIIFLQHPSIIQMYGSVPRTWQGHGQSCTKDNKKM